MSELHDAQRWVERFLTKVEKERQENKMSNKIIEALKPISKAIAGALAAIVAGFAAKLLGSFYTPEVSDAIATLVDIAVWSIIGFIVVYFSPKNK